MTDHRGQSEPVLRRPSEWLAALSGTEADPGVELGAGREGDPTLKVGGVFMHSRYRPVEEAVRLVDSAHLDLKRPAVVIGAGLGYHVADLAGRGVETLVIEPNRTVARLAAQTVLRDADVRMAVGDLDALCESPSFREFAARVPQILIHPPTAKVDPYYCERAVQAVSRACLGAHRLRVCVVGPMYGGSLPIAGYLERAFRKLGHITYLVDNSVAWTLYQEATTGTVNARAASQLGNLLAHFLSEWSYARVAEFSPDICIVLAQAPVGPTFPGRLSKEGIVTAFWYVENWRHLPYWKEVAPLYDCFFHIQPGDFEAELDRAGCRSHAYVQTACDPDLHRPIELTAEEQEEYGCDISFAGAAYRNRIEVFKGLTDYDFQIWGVGFPQKELKRLLRRPDERFDAERFRRIVAGSKINLNLHSSASHDGVDPKCDAINPRVFEIAACGGFQLCDPCIGLDTLFGFDTELPVYRDLPELRAKLDHFIAHEDERRAFARRARERVLRDHTYEIRARQMLDFITDTHGGRILRKGIRVQRTCGEMVERVGRSTPLGAYLASLPPDLLFTHENINEQLVTATNAMTYPEKVFAYLREVRNFAEMLFAEKR